MEIRIPFVLWISEKDFKYLEQDAAKHALKKGIKNWTIQRHLIWIMRSGVEEYMKGIRA